MKFNQDYFNQAVLPGLPHAKGRISSEKGVSVFFVHMDDSMCHNGHKVSEKFDQGSIERVHPPVFSRYKFLSLLVIWHAGASDKASTVREPT
jgi:hypothetical protein